MAARWAQPSVRIWTQGISWRCVRNRCIFDRDRNITVSRFSAVLPSNTFEGLHRLQKVDRNSLVWPCRFDLDVAAVGLTGASVYRRRQPHNRCWQIDSAISAVATARIIAGRPGRFEVMIQNLAVTAENFTAARIADSRTDIALRKHLCSRRTRSSSIRYRDFGQTNSLPQQALALLGIRLPAGGYLRGRLPRRSEEGNMVTMFPVKDHPAAAIQATQRRPQLRLKEGRAGAPRTRSRQAPEVRAKILGQTLTGA